MKRALRLVISIVLFNLLVSILSGQETPFTLGFKCQYSYEDMGYQVAFRDLVTNSFNEVIVTNHRHSWSYGGSSQTINAIVITPQNTYSSTQLATDYYEPYNDVFYNMLNRGHYWAFTTLTNNEFRWQYTYDTTSQPVYLTGTSYTILGTSQPDDDHCLVLFKDEATNMGEAYFMNMSGIVQWNCSIDIESLAGSDFSFNSVLYKDEDQFYLCYQSNDGNNLAKILTLSNQGVVTNTAQFTIGNNPAFTLTDVPGTLIISAFIPQYYCLYRFANNTFTQIANIEQTSSGTYSPAIADTNGILFTVYQQSNYLKLYKYDWNGVYLWERIIADNRNHFQSYNSSWCKLSPTSCIIVGYKKSVWDVLSEDTVSGPYYSWVPYFYVTKIMPDGDMVDCVDENQPVVEHAVSIYPNPFREYVTIWLTNPQSVISCRIYDIKGRLVRSFTQDDIVKGTDELNWDGKDNSSNTVARGLYILRIMADNSVMVNKIIKQ